MVKRGHGQLLKIKIYWVQKQSPNVVYFCEAINNAKQICGGVGEIEYLINCQHPKLTCDLSLF